MNKRYAAIVSLFVYHVISISVISASQKDNFYIVSYTKNDTPTKSIINGSNSKNDILPSVTYGSNKINMQDPVDQHKNDIDENTTGAKKSALTIDVSKNILIINAIRKEREINALKEVLNLHHFKSTNQMFSSIEIHGNTLVLSCTDGHKIAVQLDSILQDHLSNEIKNTLINQFNWYLKNSKQITSPNDHKATIVQGKTDSMLRNWNSMVVQPKASIDNAQPKNPAKLYAKSDEDSEQIASLDDAYTETSSLLRHRNQLKDSMGDTGSKNYKKPHDTSDDEEDDSSPCGCILM